jgi:sec-independent protein translocase protein TatC
MTDTPSESRSEQQAQDEMPLIGHLIELRARLMRMLGALAAVFFVLVFFRNDIYTFVAAPLTHSLPAGSHIVATDITAPFIAPFKLTFFVALFLVAPYWLAQIWGFISPALYKHEKKVAVPLLIASVVLFYTGIAFVYYITLTPVLTFFVNSGPRGVSVMADINLYLDFVLKLALVFGFTFEIPVAVFLLIWAGIVSTAALADKRRYVIVACFGVAMFVTPPDMFSMAVVGTLMCLLFEAGLFCGRIMEKRREAEAA